MKMRVKLEGAKEMERALGELGEEIANTVGRAAVRTAALKLRRELEATAPVGPNNLKVRTSKSGVKTRTDYGHLRDNIRHRRERERKPYTIRYIVNFGRAFWSYFREVGTVKQPARPWAVPTFERMHQQLLRTILDTLTKRTTAAAKRLARQRARRGHNGGPPLED